MNLYDDIQKAFKAIENDKSHLQPTKTIHHPKCKCVETGDVRNCNCGGRFFPT